MIYESRLELTRLLFADFDPSVRGIVAQPFLLKAEVEGQVRRHVPDYLLVTNGGQIVVDVKPRRQLSSSVVAFTLEFFLDELEEIVREWIEVVYHCRPHAGLVDPCVPGLRMSPAQMVEHGMARAGYIEVPRDPDLAFEFLATKWLRSSTTVWRSTAAATAAPVCPLPTCAARTTGR